MKEKKTKVNDMKGLLYEGSPISSSPIYRMWSNMHYRAGGNYHYCNYERYSSVVVCDEWFYLSSFFDWVVDHDWKGKELDKDILCPGSTIYSPSTCLLVPKIINYLLLDSKKIRGDLPVGVHATNRHKTPFKAECKIGEGKSKFLGRFETKEEAHAAWQKFKMQRIVEVSNELFSEGKICRKTFDSMMNRVEILKYHIKEGIETKDLHHLEDS